MTGRSVIWTDARRKRYSDMVKKRLALLSPEQRSARSKKIHESMSEDAKLRRRQKISTTRLSRHDQISRVAKEACSRKSNEAREASAANLRLGWTTEVRNRAVETRASYQPEINEKISKSIQDGWDEMPKEEKRSRVVRALTFSLKDYLMCDGTSRKFGSSWEAACANVLINLDIAFEVQHPFDLGGKNYIADFVLSGDLIIIEVKGQPEAWKRWETQKLPAIHRWLDRSWKVYVLDHKTSGVFESLSSFLSTMDQLKLGELLESPESRANHSVAGNGKRDGLKIDRIGQSASDTPVGNVPVEGSTTRPMSPNNNSAHEYPGSISQEIDHDIVCSTVKAVEVGIKSPTVTQKHGADRGHVDREQSCSHPRSAHLIAVGKN